MVKRACSSARRLKIVLEASVRITTSVSRWTLQRERDFPILEVSRVGLHRRVVFEFRSEHDLPATLDANDLGFSCYLNVEPGRQAEHALLLGPIDSLALGLERSNHVIRMIFDNVVRNWAAFRAPFRPSFNVHVRHEFHLLGTL